MNKTGQEIRHKMYDDKLVKKEGETEVNTLGK